MPMTDYQTFARHLHKTQGQQKLKNYQRNKYDSITMLQLASHLCESVYCPNFY